MDQRIVTFAGFHDHIPTIATIAARGTASRLISFPPESDAAIATITRLDPNCRFVNKHKTSSVIGRWSLHKTKSLDPKARLPAASEIICDLYLFRLTYENRSTLLCCERLDHYELAHAAPIHELDSS
jgi:hypothetical protein